jgi:hypothetical protein
MRSGSHSRRSSDGRLRSPTAFLLISISAGFIIARPIVLFLLRHRHRRSLCAVQAGEWAPSTPSYYSYIRRKTMPIIGRTGSPSGRLCWHSAAAGCVWNARGGRQSQRLYASNDTREEAEEFSAISQFQSGSPG